MPGRIALRPDQRDLGLAQQLVRGDPAGLAERDADRRADEPLAAAQRERRAQLGRDRLGDPPCLALVRDGVEDDPELVAAEAGDRVAGPQARREPLADRDQQPVADRVAEALVDDLEAVEVEQDHGDRARVVRADPRQGVAIRSVSSSRFGRPVVGSYRAPRSATSTRRALSRAIDASWAKRVRAATSRWPNDAIRRARREPDDADDLVAREERHADDGAEQPVRDDPGPPRPGVVVVDGDGRPVRKTWPPMPRSTGWRWPTPWANSPIAVAEVQLERRPGRAR